MPPPYSVGPAPCHARPPWCDRLPPIPSVCSTCTFVRNSNSAYAEHFGSGDQSYWHWLGLGLLVGDYQLTQFYSCYLRWLPVLNATPTDLGAVISTGPSCAITDWWSDDISLYELLHHGTEAVGNWQSTPWWWQLCFHHFGWPARCVDWLGEHPEPGVQAGGFIRSFQAVYAAYIIAPPTCSLLWPCVATAGSSPCTMGWSWKSPVELPPHPGGAGPTAAVEYFFSSHDGIHHARVHWDQHPLLLFTDPTQVEACAVTRYRDQATHVTHQQHLQMGLRKGQLILIYYVVGDTQYQAVFLALSSVVRGGKPKRHERKLWKHVVPAVSEFARLPRPLAESFCSDALNREYYYRTYCKLDEPHLGLVAKDFRANLIVENIFFSRGHPECIWFGSIHQYGTGAVVFRMWAQCGTTIFGNLDEASAIAQMPRKCLVIWTGDHEQTPESLRKTEEAKAFRRKLWLRPLALLMSSSISLLLPGKFKLEKWLAFVQGQRHLWPTHLVSRFSHMDKLDTDVFRKERRRLLSKHPWDVLTIDWDGLDQKLYTMWPTGLSRETLWRNLFLEKHRSNPWVEREYWGVDHRQVYADWSAARRYTDAYKGFRQPTVLSAHDIILYFEHTHVQAVATLPGLQGSTYAPLADKGWYI